ncbi:MAG TPA: PQQ-binding-like beta-propeller repeat protein [Tepidisphaeraceae bacterium]|nr:PQQ-binding-like beta-propeller repeat protein [Tepidisphaeraceae bacterium]
MRAFFLFVLPAILANSVHADDYPQWLGERRDNVYREAGVLQSVPAGGLKRLWSAPIGGGYAQVAVSGDRVVVLDRVTKGAVVREGKKRVTPGTERIVCLDDATGQEVWKVEYDCPYTISYAAGPRTTPLIAGGRVYALGAEGDVHCVELETGKVVWKRKLPGSPAIWGYAGSPVIEGELLVLLSSGKPLLTALKLDTGDVAWTAAEEADPGYAPPTPMTLGGKRQIVQYHPTGVLAIDPADGKVLWELPHGPEQNGVTIVTPVQLDADTVLLAANWTGMAAVRVAPGGTSARFLWHVKGKGREVKALQPLHSQVVLRGGFVYGVHQTGALACADPKDGRVVWADPKPLLGDAERVQWGTGFLTPWEPAEGSANRYFLATDTGELIWCELSPTGYKEIGRTKVIEPTNRDAGRPVVWCHPTYAHQSVYWRNDREVVRVDLRAEAR